MKTSVNIEVRSYREATIEYRDKQGQLASFLKRTVTGIDDDGQIVVASLGRTCPPVQVGPGDSLSLDWARAEQKDGLWNLSGCSVAPQPF